MSADPAAMTCDVPARIVWLGDRPIVELRRIDAAALREAFWDDLCKDAPAIALLPLDDCPEPAGSGPLRGAIFHTYRCGSTLLCRQLSALPGVYAIAEPDFLSQLVWGRPQEPALLRARLRKVIGLLTLGLGARGARIVIKWPGLLADRAAALVQALPEVPMLFLHRNPVEVLASIERRPLGNIDGAQTLLDLPPVASATSVTSAAAMAARVIAHLCQQIAPVIAISHCDYARLEPGIVAAYFDLEPDSADRMAMAAAGTWYSKASPGQAQFAADSAEKQSLASAEVRSLAAEVLAPALAMALQSLPDLHGPDEL